MDLANLRLIRNLRDTPRDTRDVARVIGPYVGAIVKKIRTGPAAIANLPDDVRQWQQQAVSVVPWTSRSGGAQTDVEHVLVTIGEFDRWLAQRGDSVGGREFSDQRKQLIQSAQPHFSAATLKETRLLICDWIAATFVLLDHTVLAQLTRTLLVTDAMDTAMFPDQSLQQSDDPNAVWNLLHGRTVLLPEEFQVLLANAKVELVRGAKVSDLFVVRSEWSCYRATEVASIQNVLAHTSHEHESRYLHEQETTTTEESERLELEERIEEDRTQTEISREVDRQSNLQVNIEGSVDVSGSYGLTKFQAHAGASFSAALSENTRQANRIARESVSKAVAKIESRVREERVRRLLTRSEEIIKQAINNQAGDHVRGVYRWVDRVDRYQVFRYADRLLLEFQIPEPAEYLRWRIAHRDRSGEIEKPPEFNVIATDITTALTDNNYARLAKKYRASNLPPRPDDIISLSHTMSGEAQVTPPESRDTHPWEAPSIQDTANITVPEGYYATYADFSAVAMPFRANWRVESTRERSTAKDFRDIEGFHQIVLGVVAGDENEVKKRSGPDLKEFTVQMRSSLGDQNRSRQGYGQAVLVTPEIGDPGRRLRFNGRVTGKVSVGFAVAGASSVTLSFEIRCQLSDEAKSEWENAVYDSLLEAWRTWDREWRMQNVQLGGPNLSGIDATSPSRNKEMIREELKRQVIAWLLEEQAFDGRDAMVFHQHDWDRFDLAKARRHASTIQFLEQAFEWGNISYICYPYYWARQARWGDLADLQGADPHFLQFLRSGSARVIVPARPGFESALLHWIMWQEPFLGGPLPLPGDPLYVSVATEIRDLTGAPDDGEPGESWESSVATSLLWLDDSPDLPRNDVRRLGQPPHEPKNPICSS